ncbi:MAG TPA: hypothetical protein VF267_03520, partial [Gammaproteobacteria bacterium]
MSAKGKLEPINHSLEMDEALHVHAVERITQSVAGLIILAIVIVAVLGLFGDGKLVNTTLRGETAALR